MSDEIITLSEASIQLIKDLIDKDRGSISNTENRPTSDEADYPGSEVYIALALYGIPAISGFVPGSSNCDIYQLIQSTGILNPLGITEWVYNLFPTDVSIGAIVPIVKDKSGNWLVAGNTIDILNNTINNNTTVISDYNTWNITGYTFRVSTTYFLIDSLNVLISGGSSWTYDASTFVIYNGWLTFCGFTFLCYYDPDQWVSDKIDWVPFKWANVFRISTDVLRTLRSLVPPVAVPIGRQLIAELHNVGPGPFKISHEDTLGSTAYRFKLPEGNPITYQVNEKVRISYDPEAQRWGILDTASANASSACATGIIWNEVPAGLINGTNRVFHLSKVPSVVDFIPLLLKINGLDQYEGISKSYIRTGRTIAFNPDCQPLVGDDLYATYPYDCSSGEGSGTGSGSAGLICCPSIDIPPTIHAAVTGCACISGDLPIVYASVDPNGYSSVNIPGWFSAPVTCIGHQLEFALFATPFGSDPATPCTLHVLCNGVDTGVTPSSGSCSSILDLMFDFSFSFLLACCESDVTVHLTN